MFDNIFIIGKAGSGKDTIAEILKECGYTTYALAAPIREEYKRFFPDKNPRHDRNKLIEMGQTYKKLYGEDVWIRLTNELISLNNSSKVCIIDGRYKVEYDFYVNQLGYFPLRVFCQEELRLERLIKRDGNAQIDALKKESNELDNMFAYNLDNSKSLSSTRYQIECLLDIRH